MRESGTETTYSKTNIQCIEVLISKNHFVNTGRDLSWTLSVYSLENQPIKANYSIPGSETFHFMVYDWKRTIKQLLEDNQVLYSVIQFFSLNDLCSDSMSTGIHSIPNEIGFPSALADDVNESPVQDQARQKKLSLI